MTPDAPAPHPSTINYVATPTGGRIGMVACPGRRRDGLIATRAPLDEDLEALTRWGASILVTLAERSEWRALGASDLAATAEAHGLRWRHAPIPDMQEPGAAALAAWDVIAPELMRELEAGGRIAIHCAAGLGRTGTMTATLLVQCGIAPEDAVARVRAARPGAIETAAQLRFVLDVAPGLPAAGAPAPAR